MNAIVLAALLAAAAPSASPVGDALSGSDGEAHHQSMRWREIGPALPGGRAANVAGSAKNPNLYYVAAAGGGGWKSTDGGETWNSVFDKQPVASIGDVVMDPTDGATVGVATGEGNPRNDVIPGAGVYKSTNGGKDWTAIGIEKTRTITRLLVDPKNPNHVLVAALGDSFAPSEDRGVYVTDDGGKTWTKTLYVGNQSGASDLAMDSNDPNIVYAGMWHFERRPWTTESGGPDDGLYKSTDGGKSWTQLTGHGLPGGTIGRIGLAVAPSNPNRVYATIEASKGVLLAFRRRRRKLDAREQRIAGEPAAYYSSHLAVDPSNPDHVFGISVVLVIRLATVERPSRPLLNGPHR